MKHEYVASSNISSTAYDRKSRTIEVKFMGGEVYVHKDVSEKVHNQLRSADNPGKFYLKQIKNQYPGVKKA